MKGHFLWGSPSGSCCLSLLTSYRLREPGGRSSLCLENIYCREQEPSQAVSQARMPRDSTVLWLLPPHYSVWTTETIR